MCTSGTIELLEARCQAYGRTPERCKHLTATRQQRVHVKPVTCMQTYDVKMRSVWWRSLFFFLWAFTFGGNAVATAQGTAASGARPKTRVVRTADEFMAAFRDGVLHIVVGAHIDLTGMEASLDIEFKGYDFDKPLIKLNGTASVRVRTLPTSNTGQGHPSSAACSCHAHRQEEAVQPRSAAAPQRPVLPVHAPTRRPCHG